MDYIGIRNGIRKEPITKEYLLECIKERFSKNNIFEIANLYFPEKIENKIKTILYQTFLTELAQLDKKDLASFVTKNKLDSKITKNEELQKQLGKELEEHIREIHQSYLKKIVKGRKLKNEN